MSFSNSLLIDFRQTMNSKFILLVTGSAFLAAIFLFSPRNFVHAQDGGCFDASGGSIPCPSTEEKQEQEQEHDQEQVQD